MNDRNAKMNRLLETMKSINEKADKINETLKQNNERLKSAVSALDLEVENKYKLVAELTNIKGAYDELKDLVCLFHQWLGHMKPHIPDEKGDGEFSKYDVEILEKEIDRVWKIVEFVDGKEKIQSA